MQAAAAELSGYAGKFRCFLSAKSFKQSVPLQYRSKFPPEPIRERLYSAKISSAAADEIFGLVSVHCEFLRSAGVGLDMNFPTAIGINNLEGGRRTVQRYRLDPAVRGQCVSDR
jgi:hypothetical protein